MTEIFEGSDWNRPGDDRDRQNIIDNTDDEYRLPNLVSIIPKEHWHPIVKDLIKSGDPNITIYRGVPEHVSEIRPGDWVTLTRSYAKLHSAGKIVAKRVPISDVAWAGTDINEYYYVPTGSK